MSPIPTIGSLMTESPHTIGSDIPLATAQEMMRAHGVRHLPVQHGGKIVGVLTDRDVKLALTLVEDRGDLVVEDVMTDEPYAVPATAPIDQVLREMATHKYGCAIVKNERDRAIGIFTVTDAVRVLAERIAGDAPRPARAAH